MQNNNGNYNIIHSYIFTTKHKKNKGQDNNIHLSLDIELTRKFLSVSKKVWSDSGTF